MVDYLVHSKENREKMFKYLGIKSVEELFNFIPEKVLDVARHDHHQEQQRQPQNDYQPRPYFFSTVFHPLNSELIIMNYEIGPTNHTPLNSNLQSSPYS